MSIFRRKFVGRTAGAFLFAFILFTPSAAGACATTPYSYTIVYTPTSPAFSLPTPVPADLTYNYFEPRTVPQSSMASLPNTINTPTWFDNGTGLATSPQSRPASLDASSVTYNYQVNQPVLTDNWVDEGSWHWHANVVDQGFNHWHANLVDHGWWVSSGYYAGGYVNTQVWNDTSHQDRWTHTDIFAGSVGIIYYTCNSHVHSGLLNSNPAHLCAGSPNNYTYEHYNGNFTWHSAGNWTTIQVWSTTVNWVDTTYWQPNVTDDGAWHWHSNWVDIGSNHWHSNWVNHPVWVANWVSYTSQPSLPAGAINVTYNANYIAQDQYIADSRIPLAAAYQKTYNYVATFDDGCALPT